MTKRDQKLMGAALFGGCALAYMVPAVVAAGGIAGWWVTGDSQAVQVPAVGVFGFVGVAHALAALWGFRRASSAD